MQSIGATKFNIAEMVEETKWLEWTLDGSDALMAYPPAGGLPEDLDNYPQIKRAVYEIAALRGQEPLNLMINKLGPGVNVPVHRDWIRPTKHQPVKPCVERWHLPILTNPGSMFWHEGGPDGGTHFPLGEWYGPIPYWLQHSVCNNGGTERIHIVVDLNTPTKVGYYAEDRRVV